MTRNVIFFVKIIGLRAIQKHELILMIRKARIAEGSSDNWQRQRLRKRTQTSAEERPQSPVIIKFTITI